MLNEIPLLKHAEPSTINEASSLLSRYGDKAKIIAGGTDLLGLIKDNVSGPKMPIPEVLVNIGKIPELGVFEFNEKSGLKIGAAITLAELEESKIVQQKFPLIQQAAASVAMPQIRNVGTIAGNLCQRPWCWYFRSPDFSCFKKGGKQCYAITGENQYYFSVMGLGVCVMSHPSDLAPALIALDSELEIASPSGIKKVSVEKFFLDARSVFETILGPDEFVVSIDVPNPPVGARMAYLKNGVRSEWDFALASTAALLELSGDVCINSRIVLGGLAPFPYRAFEAEERLRNVRVNEQVAQEAADKAMTKARGLSLNGYKLQIGTVIARRAIMSALSSGGSTG